MLDFLSYGKTGQVRKCVPVICVRLHWSSNIGGYGGCDILISVVMGWSISIVMGVTMLLQPPPQYNSVGRALGGRL